MSKVGETFEKLVAVIAKLRDPNGGCPWDLEQTHESLKPYIIEECYEVIDAIDNNRAKLSEELGDVLLQVVLHAQVSKDNGAFNIEEIIEVLTAKLIKRHPHVFADVAVNSTKEVLENWEKIKKSEKKKDESVLDSVPKHLPALLKAQRMGEKAARLGFDWNDGTAVKEKIREEIEEFIASEGKESKEEFGDLLFALTQLARKVGIDSEDSLSQTCNKFADRFRYMEQRSEGKLKELSLAQQEELWQEAKKRNL